MTAEQPQKPQIIVDDNWKEKVQAEKEAQRNKETPPADQPRREPAPPASFSLLVTSMATQALAEMGQIPDAAGKTAVRLDHAKHVIDMLGVLETKTQGNLSADESAILTRLLHELRMIFVAVRQQAAATPPRSD